MNNKTIQTADINSRVHQLPVMFLGIRGIESLHEEYTRLLESIYTYSDSIAHSANVAAAIKGNDFQGDLQRLKSIKQYTDEGQTSNPVDDYVHETLKAGIPSGETAVHIVNTIGDSTVSLRNQNYLSQKWGPLLKTYIGHTPEIKDLNRAQYSRSDISRIPHEWKVSNARLIFHPTTSFAFEMHPEHGFKFIGQYQSDDIKQNSLFEKASIIHNRKNLFEHYQPYSLPAIKQYTSDSTTLNQYLYKKHGGKLEQGPDTYRGVPFSSIEERAKQLSENISSVPAPTHLNDFYVYTGIHSENDPEHTGVTNENGHYIFHNPAFTSTSIDRATAYEFARKKRHDEFPGGSVRDVLKIRVPGGYPNGFFVEPHTEYEGEEEYLLDKGHNFVVNPKPRYYAVNNTIHREWDAEIHPLHLDLTKPFHEMSRHEKINALLHPDAKQEHLREGAGDQDFDVVTAAAKHPNTPHDVLMRLSESPNYKTRVSAFRNTSFPKEIAFKEAGKANVSAAHGMSMRPDLTEHEKNSMCMLSPLLSKHMAKRSDLTQAQANMLYEKHNNEIHEYLSSNIHVHPDVLEKLVNSPDTAVRSNLALNPAINDRTFNLIRNDSNSTVAFNTKHNPKSY